MTDLLIEAKINVEPVLFGAVAKDNDRFKNLKAEIFFNLREEFENQKISIPKNEHLLAELPSLMYEITSNGKMGVVGKDQMKK